jgi:hypothetical protein
VITECITGDSNDPVQFHFDTTLNDHRFSTRKALRSNFRDTLKATTMNLLRDNSLALVLAAFCLILSAWLYVANAPSRPSAGQLDAADNRTRILPDIATPRDAAIRIAAAPEKSPPEKSSQPSPRAKPIGQAQQRNTGASDQAGDAELPLSPTDWRPAN